MSSVPASRNLPSVFALVSLLAMSRPAAASLGDEPRVDPGLELDPRAAIDPRIDRPDPPRARSTQGRARAPIWFAIGASMGTLANGAATWGAELQVGIPLDRLALRGPRAALAQDMRPPRSSSSPSDAPDAPGAPGARHKLDLTPPPPPPKLTPSGPPTPEVPLRVPVIITTAAARAAVDAALRRAHLIDPDVRIDALATRARQSAGLPELRLRVLRTADDGNTLSPVSYDPNRLVMVDTIQFWAEARATWKLDRALFAEEEVTLERIRHEQAEARGRLTKEVLRLLFEWQRARAHADNPLLSAEDNLAARLKLLETAAELDVLTDGWFTAFRARHPEADVDGAPAALPRERGPRERD